MAQHEPIRKKPANPEIPDRLYFRIGDVARLCAVPSYVLRFWETEFPQLKPNKGGTGQRLYRRRDVEMAVRIKRLLYDEGYTIPGARQALQDQRATPEPQLPLAIDAAPSPSNRDLRLHLLRNDLQSLHTLLSNPAASLAPTIQSMRLPRGPRLVSSLTLAPKPIRSPMDDLFDPRPPED